MRSEISSGGCSAKSPLLKMSWYRPEAVLLVFSIYGVYERAGQTVYLKVSVEELAKRLELCKSTRPILKGRSGDELKAFIAESLEKREPFYSKASIVFDAEEMMTDQDVYKISQELATRL